MKSYGPSQGFRPPNRKRKNVPDYFPKYYTMDPEAEDVLFGHELRNDMVVMIEGAAFKADLDSYDPASSPFIEGLPAYVEDSALRMNRWMTVNRLSLDERDREIHFIGVYEDGTKSAHSWDKNTGWIVKKLSIPDGWLEVKMVPLDQEGESSSAFEWAKQNGYDIVKLSESGAIAGSAEAVQAMIQQEGLTQTTTAASLKEAGYSNVAIGQIMLLTEKRVLEILERHAETPFLKETTRRNLLDDLDSGRLRLEVPPFQNGRDVTAIIKPGPNYRPVDPEFEAQKKRLQLEASRRVLAHRMTGEGKSVEEISKFLDISVELVKLLLSSEPTESEMDSNHMLNLKYDGKFPPCTCSEHGPCPLHKTN